MARQVSAPRAARWLAVAAISLATTGGLLARDARAEEPVVTPASSQAKLFGGLSAEDRERMFSVLGQQADEIDRNNMLKMVVKLTAPSVVHIEAKKRATDTRGYGRTQSVEETGSGVIIEWNGGFYVLTNRHVVKDAELLDINIGCADGRVLQPAKYWGDRDTDVAVLSLSADKLVPARVGNSDSTEIGDFVLAAGSPFGLAHSVTYGIISAKGRRDLELADGGVRYQDFMQTDASINPGNSGGPLINLRGEVIGINTAIATNSGRNEGIGFSIPINMAMAIAKQLIDHGSVNRAFLGVTLDAKFTPAAASDLGLPRLMGARIVRVNPQSPAEAAHLEVGDVIVLFNGMIVEDDKHLVNIISGFTEAGSEVPMVVYRNRAQVPMTIKVGSHAEE